MHGKKSMLPTVITACLAAAIVVQAGERLASDLPVLPDPGMAETAMAAEDMGTETGNMTVYFRYGNDQIPLADMDVSLYYVADVDVDRQDFTPVQPWAELATASDFDALETASQWGSMAEYLADSLASVSADSLITAAGQTDSSGKLLFEDLDTGLYLIVAEGTDTYDTSPELVTVPQYVTGSDGLVRADYDVIIHAKTEAKQLTETDTPSKITLTTPTPTPTPTTTIQTKTGDESNAVVYFAIVIGCAAVVCIGIKRKS